MNETEQRRVLEYIENASVCEIVELGENKYILTHAGIQNFQADKKWEEYDVYDFIEGRADYSKRYFEDENTYLVTGHTPTFYITGWKSCDVVKKNGHIAIDCGCTYGGKLAAYCLNTGNVTYVKGI